MRRTLDQRAAKIEQDEAALVAKRARYRKAVRNAQAEHLRSVGRFSKEAGLLELRDLTQRELRGLVTLKADLKERRRWEEAGRKAEVEAEADTAESLSLPAAAE